VRFQNNIRDPLGETEVNYVPCLSAFLVHTVLTKVVIILALKCYPLKPTKTQPASYTSEIGYNTHKY